MNAFEDNLGRFKNYIERFKSSTMGHFINGEFIVPSDNQLLENRSPVDQQSLGKFAMASEAEVDQACEAAAAAFPAWRDINGAKRRELLHAFADRIVERADEIALIESMDTGQAIRFMKKAALRAADNFRFFADKAPEATAGLSSFQDEHTNFSSRTPIGPVGIITPWNTPFMSVSYTHLTLPTTSRV